MIHRDILVFSFITVIQAKLNELMRAWNCWNIRELAEALGGVSEILFNVPTVAGFPKKGTNVNIRVKQTDKETISIAQYSIYFNKKRYTWANNMLYTLRK